MSKYEELASFIVENVGGKKNILGLAHCVTRLRFTLNDMGLINETALKNKDGIATAQVAGGQYQVVIGTHVGDVYEEVMQKLDGQKLQEKNESSGRLNAAISVITKSITPLLGGMVACGLIQAVLSVLNIFGLAAEGTGSYLILNAMGQAIFQFFPVLVGYTAAKAFKLDPSIGMIIGAVLIFPGLTESMTQGQAIMNLFSGTPFVVDVYQNFFGIPILFPSFGYSSAIIPTIIIVYLAAKLNQFLKRVIPTVMAFTVVPFLTILIIVPISFLIVGPILNILMQSIGLAVTGLYGLSKTFGAAIVAMIYQPLVILGLHWPLITIGMGDLGKNGYDTIIMPTLFSASFAQFAVVAAVYFRTKSQNMKNICLPAMISALFCIIEPAIYGVTLPVKKRFAFSMIGGGVGAAIMCTFGSVAFAPVVGIFGFAGYINPNGEMRSLIVTVIGVITAMAVAFLLTFFTFREEIEESENTTDQKEDTFKESILTAPLEGQVSNLEMAEDSAFSKGLLGEGILIYPSIGKLVAPCSGEVTTVFPTGHAVGITNIDGVEVLIHLGKDTVHLKGEHFNVLVKQGDFVKRGELLVEFKINEIEEAGFSLETPIVITNSHNYPKIEATSKEYVKFSDEVLSVEIEKKVQPKVQTNQINELGVE